MGEGKEEGGQERVKGRDQKQHPIQPSTTLGVLT